MIPRVGVDPHGGFLVATPFDQLVIGEDGGLIPAGATIEELAARAHV